MKSAVFSALLCLTLFLFCNQLLAQKAPVPFQRCATMERVRYHEKKNTTLHPFKVPSQQHVTGTAGNFRLQEIVTIPVVMHIVLPNPYIITDADVQAQIDRLNLDFSGLNPDSTNAVNFYSLRGHSNIRFTLARQSPAGQPTNGIERRFSQTGSNADADIDPIKRNNLGGLDAWNTNSYLNLWVGTDLTGRNVLGYADNIGPGSSLDDGVFINYQSFGSSPCYALPQYNRGRTTTHEVGHFFGLYHIWGDDEGRCNGDDFAQLPTSTNAVLPAGLYNPEGQGNSTSDVGDTPNQGNMTTSCPGGTVLDACSALAPGKMYQNHMDYTQDACLSLFTNKQVARMEWVLDNSRAGLKNSPGILPPAGSIALDAAILNPVSPGGFELIGCRSVYYTDSLSCPGSITPKFRVVNNGASTLTSLTASYRYDDDTPISQTLTLNLAPGGTQVVSFAPLAATTGTHILRFFIQSPNGAADQNSSNDSYTQTFVVMAPLPTPVFQDFEKTPPYAGWTIDNPDYDFTWQRRPGGKNSSAGLLAIDNYNREGYGRMDDFRSTALQVDAAAAYALRFDRAYKYSGYPQFSDTLSVYLSTDCGQSFTRLFYKGGADLATAGQTTSEYATPAAGDWKREILQLNPLLLSSGKVILVFRNTSGYGNWLYLENIELVELGTKDLRVQSIIAPGNTACPGTLSPVAVIENAGMESITAFSLGYRIDNGPVQQQHFVQNLPPGTTATLALPTSAATSGTHQISVFSFDPVTASGTGDTNPGNDTLTKKFTVVQPATQPLTEDFENDFPSAGWSVFNPDNNNTWVRQTPGRASGHAAFIDNFNHNLVGQADEIRSPYLNVAGADSVLIRFDLAHKNYPGTPADQLTILTTGDCAATFTPVYQKAGAALATAGSTTADYTLPSAPDWRTESITLTGPALATGTLGVAFRNSNDYGNNLFLDNLSITPVFRRNLELVSLAAPTGFVCTSSVTPAVKVRNAGTDVITAFQLVYTLNGGAEVAKTISGLSLERGQEANLTLAAITGLAPGQYTLRIFSTMLLTQNGSGDLHPQSDSLTLTFVVAVTQRPPLLESFSSPVFPPAGWNLLPESGTTRWQHSPVGNSNSGAARHTPSLAGSGGADNLVLPRLQIDAVDSVKLSFDLASAGAADGRMVDTLEVRLSADCGNSFTTVYKKWGAALQTTGIPAALPNDFVPQTGADWRSEVVDLSFFAYQSPFALFFRLSHSTEKSVYLDNIQLTTKTVPSQLKQQGYLLFPAPFKNSFTVWHYQFPTTLRYIVVRTISGQTVWQKSYSGGADKQEVVDLSGKAAGIYFVEWGYANGKTISHKLIKEL